MDAIASEGLAIGHELVKHAFFLVAALSLLGLLEGRGVELGFKIPSFSLILKVWPRLKLDATVLPHWETLLMMLLMFNQTRGSKDEEFAKPSEDNQQQVDSRED